MLQLVLDGEIAEYFQEILRVLCIFGRMGKVEWKRNSFGVQRAGHVAVNGITPQYVLKTWIQILIEIVNVTRG